MFRQIDLSHVLLLAALVFTLYGVRRSLPGTGLRAWHDRHTSPHARARWHHVLALELTELVLAGIFLMVGGAKLVGRPDMVALFHDIGVGQWFRYATGTIEVTGAALLIVPMLSGASALLLGAVMAAAALIELFVLHRPPVAAVACLSAHSYVAWARTSRRHLSWLHVTGPARHPLALSSNESVKARWDFSRIKSNRRIVRRASSAYPFTP
ncbi:MAG: DoxX family protein [bacterium]